jgi:UDP-glucose 4-epimerase
MKLFGKNIMVTGGAGFIGSHLVDTLLHSNKVIVVDDLSSGEIDNFKHHLGKDNFTFIQTDINDLDQMSMLLRDTQVVFHLAAKCLRVSLSEPGLAHTVNASGTLNLCKLARAADIERFFYMSSSEVYGTAKIVPMTENHPLEPTTPYGASKLAGEAYARSYFLSFGLPVVIVRPFNCYGPREHMKGASGEVIPRFVLRVMNGQSPVIFGDGSQTRDFTYVDDIVRGLVLACECDSLVGQTINIAAGEEVSVLQIARIITGLLDEQKRVEPAYMASRPGDVQRHSADISKAQKVLGFKPQVGIEEGIGQYISWIKQQDYDIQQLFQEEILINWST